MSSNFFIFVDYLVLCYICISMGKRSYQQFCTLALALDVVGERWTLLVIRELLTGPKRFTDLLNGLPGIGTNLLSARLKQMESYDLITRGHLPPPAASNVYELTEVGKSLDQTISALAHWGASVIAQKRVTRQAQYFKAGWMMLAMKYIYNEELALSMHGTYEIGVDDEVMHVIVKDGKVEPRLGPADSPSFSVSMDLETYKAMLLMEYSLEELIAQGKIQVKGSVADAMEFYELMMPAIGSQFEMVN